MNIEVKDVKEKHYKHLDQDSIKLIRSLCRGIDEKYLMTLPYGKIIWENDKFLNYGDNNRDALKIDGDPEILKKFESFCNQCQYPIGIVIKGIFEVFDLRPTGGKSTARPQANILLKPGTLFGLYETFANLHGQWSISAGVKSILISNNKGTGDVKIVGGLAETLQHTKESSYDYKNFVEAVKITINDWNAQCIIFDANKIDGANHVELLYRMTIDQLVALVRQHPQLVICDPNELKSIDVNIRDMARTVDAMIDGQIPIHTLATDEDYDFLPLSILTKYIEKLFSDDPSQEDIDSTVSNEKKQFWLDIWRPCLLDSSHKVGVYFPKVANKFIRGDLSDLFKSNYGEQKFFDLSGGSRCWVDRNTIPGVHIMRWTTKNSKKQARIIPYGLHQKPKSNQKHKPKLYESININDIIKKFPISEDRDGLGYQWPKHINTAFVIELI